MKNWTKPAITILALAVMSHLTSAQSGGDQMAKPMGKVKTYTGCIEAGASAGTFNLTHAMADMGMGKDAMGKEAMKKDPMVKDAMGKEAMPPASIAISGKTIDLSKHVGHKVSVTGAAADMGMAQPDAMAKPDEMGKKMPVLAITAIKMIATTCTM